MLENIFNGLFNQSSLANIGIGNFILCIITSLILGGLIALCYMFKTNYSQSFVITLAMLPAVVCVVILLINGNIGAGIAVAGAFSLVRFRSAQGTAREICMIFFAMTAGFICGMGCLGMGLLFTLIICFMFILYSFLGFGLKKNTGLKKNLKIVIPEDLDYTCAFEDIFHEYLKSSELVNLKTPNMGNVFKLTYNITLKDNAAEKEMIDKLRSLNGGLEIQISKAELANTDL